MTGKKILRSIMWIAVLLLAVSAVVSARLYYEYLQYLDIGYKYTTMFFTNLKVKALSFILSFAAVFVIILINGFVIRRIAYKYNDDWSVIKNPVYTVVNSFLLSVLATTFISSELYENVLPFLYSVPFGKADPLFGNDIGYYMFTRPFYMNVLGGIKYVLVINLLFTVAAYAVLWMRSGIGGLRDMLRNRHVVAHTLVNIMIIIITIALGYKFSIEELMYKSFCGVTGAGATHIRIWYPYYSIAPFMLVVIVPLGLYFLYKKKFRRATWTVAAFPIVWMLAIIAGVTYQTMFVDSDELNMENEYLAYNMQMTKSAYGLENVFVQEFDAAEATEADMAQIREVSEYADISDMSIITDVYNSEQYIENKYKFYEADIVPYTIDGERRTVTVSAREVSDTAKKIDASYSGSKFLNTFGSGLVMSSSTEKQGEYFIYGVPAVTDMGIAGIANNSIYYSENAGDMVVVNTSYDDEDYIGIGGVQLTPMNRFIIGMCSGDFRLVTNNGITSKSRALMNRNIVERVKKIAPFFEYDSDPYIIVDDKGVIKWVMDAYSVSDKYPYSQSRGGINYISPCAKVIIDAYSGIVDFYVTDEKEPMMRMYRSIYPYMFSEGELPDSIKNYMRYPEDVFAVQSDIYRKYYMSDVKEFYSGATTLDYVKRLETGSDVVGSWYTVTNGKVYIAVPLTKNGDSISAYFTASCEPSAYGTLNMSFINNGGFDTVAQVQNVISSDEQITKHINNLGKNGATVRQGEIRILPVNNSVIYAAPLYITGDGGSKATTMEDVIVVMDGRAAVSTDIETAAKTLMSVTGSVKKGTAEEQSAGDIINRIVDLYKRVNLYRKVGDWENYGRAMEEFDTAMKELAERNDDRYFNEIFVGPQLSAE